MDFSGISNRTAEVITGIIPRLEAPSGDSSAINLSVSENALLQDEMLQLIKEGINTGLQRKHLSYAPGVGGDPELRRSLAGFFNTYFLPTTKVKPEHIVVTAGGGSALGALMRSICDEGDSVLLLCPIWDGLGLYLLIHGNIKWINVTVPWLENGPQRSLVEELERAYLNHPNPDRIKAVVFANPNNPLGRCYEPSVLRECLAFCAEKALHCISDEVYAMSSFSSSAPFPRFTSILSLLDDNLPATLASRVHVIWSASKDFGCNGLRLGCIISQSNDTLRLGSGLTSYSEVSSLTTVMTIALLNSPHLPSLIAKSSERLTAAYNLLTRGFERLHIKFIPANYGLCVFFRLVDNCSSAKEETAAVHELAQLGLVVSQGQNYALGDGVWGWARIIFAYPPDVIQRALDVLEKFRRGRGGCD